MYEHAQVNLSNPISFKKDGDRLLKGKAAQLTVSRGSIAVSTSVVAI